MSESVLTRSRLLAGGALVVVTAVLASLTTVAVANHFPDVTPGSFFDESIHGITGAGCAVGFPDGTFRPDDNPTRGQFAFWTNNCGGRVGFNSTTDSDFDANETAQLAPVTMLAGAQGTGQAFISLQANVTVYDPDAANCPCQVTWLIREVGTNTVVSTLASETLGSVAAQNGGTTISGSVGGRYQVAAGEEPKFQVEIAMQDNNNNNSVATADLTAIYVPFGPFGSTLG